MVNKRKFHGQFSFVLLYSAFGIGVLAFALNDWRTGLAYGSSVIIASMIVYALFCSRCTIREKCAHLIPGLIGQMFPKARPRSYKLWEFLILLTCFGGLIAAAQFPLINRPIMLILFWLLFALASIEIRRKLCPGCENSCCPLRVLKLKQPDSKNVVDIN